MGWRLLALLACTACGRLHFDDTSDAGADAMPLPAPVYGWVQPISGAGLQIADAIAATSTAIVVGGHYRAVTDFGGGPRALVGGDDAYVVGYDSAGGYLWDHVFSTALEDKTFALALDEAGNSYAAGRVGGNVDFGGGLLQASGAGDIFIVSYAPGGDYRWAKIVGSTAPGEMGFGVVARDGQVTLTGWFEQTVDFGDGPRTAAAGEDAFVATFDLDGTAIRTWRFGGSGSVDQGQKVSVAQDGRVAVAGLFNGTIELGAGPVTSAGSHDLFAVVFDATGNPIWSVTGGDALSDQATGIAIAPSGGAAVAGRFEGTLTLGTESRTSLGVAGVLVGIDDRGAVRWLQTLDGASTDTFDECLLGPDGVIVVSGGFVGDASIAGQPLQPRGDNDIVLAGFDRAGTLVWTYVIASPILENVRGIALAPDGTIYAVGAFTGPVDFGGGLVTPTNSDGFVLKLTR